MTGSANVVVAGCALAVIGVGAAASSVTVVVGGPVLATLAMTEVGRRRRTARVRRQTSDLIDSVDAIILRLRSGDSIRLALSESSADEGAPEACTHADSGVRDWLAVATTALTAGHTMRSAVTALVADHRTRTDDRFQLTAVTLSALVERGGPALPALRRLRFALAGIGQASDEANAQAGQARSSSVLMAAAPVSFAVVLAMLDHRARHLYLYSTSGLVCLGTAVALSYGGWLWMALVINRSVNPVGGGVRGRRGDPNQQLGHIVELVAMVLAAGGTIRDAVVFVAQTGPDPERLAFSQALSRSDHGELLADALPAISDDLGGGYRSLVAAMVLGSDGGASISYTLGQLSDEADAARRRDLERRAKQVSVRLLVPVLVCSLPALIIGAIVPLVLVALSHLSG